MNVAAMSNVDSATLQHGTRRRSNSGTEGESVAGTDIAGGIFRSEYPATCSAPPMPLHAAGPCSSFYNAPGQVGYPDYSDRYSVGYQRMGQTITLTSHKIQFGCQSGRPYGQQRFAGHGYNPQYQMMQQHLPGKPWSDPPIERTGTSHSSKPNNRGRTTYSDEQIAELESVFNTNPYPTSQTRQHLAYKIDVPEGKVKIWFQNRRARAKKSKLGCGGGSWRPQHGETRHCEEGTNQNNNNAKDCFKSEPLAISINSILPLPTKSTINTLSAPNWKGVSGSYPWKSQFDGSSQGFRPCLAHPNSSAYGCYHCASDTTYSINPKPWNWNFSAHNHPISYRSNQTLENMGAKEQFRSTAGPTSPWNYAGTVGGVPDLINQTSKFGIIGPATGVEGDIRIGDEGLIHSRTTIGADRCPTAPPSNTTAFISQEKRQSYFAEELSSPPPIRRLIFPFHTLTEGRSTGVESTGTASLTSDNVTSTKIGSVGSISGIVAPEDAKFSESFEVNPYTKPTTLAGNYQATSQSTSELGTYVQMQRADSKWEASSVKVGGAIPEVREKVDAHATAFEGDSSPKAQPGDGEEDDDATDDAVDEPGMNDYAAAERREVSDKPSYSLASREPEQFISSCWSNRTDSNILVKAMEFAGEETLDGKQREDGVVGRLTNLHPDLSQSVDATGIWANQFVSSMYPPSSASMVG